MTLSAASLFDLSGRRALVTGATGGIGRAIALALASAGASLVISGRAQAALEGLADEIGRVGGQAVPWVADLSDPAGLQPAVDQLLADGGIDVLVNCAGTIARGSLSEIDDASWDHVFGVNLRAPFQFCRMVAPWMVQRGWGRILNVGSALSVQGKANAVAYVSAKHGLAGLTRALAAELGPAGVCVNALCPGYVRTDITAALQKDPAYVARIAAATPLGRWAQPEDMAGPALFLCSPAASYVNGLLLLADGGMTATH